MLSHREVLGCWDVLCILVGSLPYIRLEGNVVIWCFINKVDLNNCFFPKVRCRIRVRVIIYDDRPQRVTLHDSYFKMYIL